MTLSQLKRDINGGQMQAELVFSKPAGNDRALSQLCTVEKGKGERFVLRTRNIRREFSLPRAALVEYQPEENRLTIYKEGYRSLTEDEKKAMREWKIESRRPDYQKKAERARYYHSTEAYWHRRSFFEERGMLYLMGKEEADGQLLDWDRFRAGNPLCIMDKSVRGDVLYIFSVKLAG